MFSPSLHFMLSVAPVITDPVTETEAPSSGLEMTVGEVPLGPGMFIRGYDEGDFGSITGTFDGGLVPSAIITGPDDVLTIQFTGEYTTTLADGSFEFGSSYGTHAVADASSAAYDGGSDTTTFTWSAFGQFVNAEVVAVALTTAGTASKDLVGDATLATVEVEGAMGGQALIGDATLATVEAEGELLAMTEELTEAVTEELTEAVTEAPAYTVIETAKNDTNQTTLTVTKPAGTVEGEVLLAFVGWDNHSISQSVPSGWTQIGNKQEVGTYSRVYRKVAGASEPASYDFGFSAGVNSIGAVVRIVGPAASPTYVAISAGASSGSNAGRLDPVTTTADDALLFSMMYTQASGGTDALTPPSGSEELMQETNAGAGSGGGMMGVAFEIFPTAGGTGTRSYAPVTPTNWTTHVVGVMLG